MRDMELALSGVRMSDRARFIGPRDESRVESAERALGLTFPPTYRRFLLELGAGAIGSREFYGITDGRLLDGGIPNGIWLTVDERRRLGLPHPMVIVGDSGDGEYYVLDTSLVDSDGECGVSLWDARVGGDPSVSEVVAPDFGTFFLAAVNLAQK